MADSEKKTKKSGVYPFPVRLNSASAVISGQIVNLNQLGFLADVKETQLQAGDKFECSFEVPGVNSYFRGSVLLVKLYNQWASKPGPDAQNPTVPSSVRLIEVHFQNLPAEQISILAKFLRSQQRQSQ